MDYRGYWMNSKSGKTISTNEHGSTILAKPEIFGISKNDIAAITKKKVYNPGGDGKNNSRPALLKKAFDNGWVRIRIANSSWTCEFSGNMSSVVAKIIKKFGDDMGPFTRINLHDIHSKDNKSFTYTEMVDAYNSGAFDDEQANTRDKMRQRLFPAGSEETPHFSLESLKRLFKKTLFKSA
jgi:hypothetical protein